MSEIKSEKKVIVILGGPLLQDKTPGLWLQSRIDQAIKTIFSLKPDFIIASGGDPLKVGITEAEVINNNLIDANITQKIYLEKKSMTTYENAANTKYKLNTILKNFNVNLYIRTSDFHIERSRMLFDYFFKGTNCKITMIASITPVHSSREYHDLIENEKKAIAKLKVHIGETL
jgi:uncharacterized SAM-binding protein YcdF (DUF218 family)